MAPIGVDRRLAHRWFWTLLVIAVLAMGVLYRALKAQEGLSAALTVLLSSLVLLVSTAQAARIVSALAGSSTGHSAQEASEQR